MCKVLTCLACEIIIMNLKVFSQNHIWSISLMMKKINKIKRIEIQDSMLVTRRLFSENVLIIADSKFIKEQLKCDSSWLTVISQTAKINHRRFSIMMHEMCVAVLNCSQQVEVIKQLMRQNHHLKRKLEILHVCWSVKIIKHNKAVFYLMMNVITSVQVNMLIDEDLLFQSKLKQCELYHEDCRLMQCFNYYRYEYTVKICCQNKKCSICTASNHNDMSLQQKAVWTAEI